MLNIKQLITASLVIFTTSVLSSENPILTGLQQQVSDAEKAFAQTMAQRDFEGFVSFLSEEAVFFSGPTVLRGKQQVADAWKGYYEKPDAPFSWEPERVEVLDSGTLALSTGPVYGPEGTIVATYNSIWRLEKTGKWKVVFDKGNDVCDGSEP
jgi:ketosteroid isomerase-like protein